MDLEDTGSSARFRDRDRKFPALFDVIFADASIQVVLNGVCIPRINSIIERWIQNRISIHTLEDIRLSRYSITQS
jgi:putative transposase